MMLYYYTIITKFLYYYGSYAVLNTLYLNYVKTKEWWYCTNVQVVSRFMPMILRATVQLNHIISACVIYIIIFFFRDHTETCLLRIASPAQPSWVNIIKRLFSNYFVVCNAHVCLYTLSIILYIYCLERTKRYNIIIHIVIIHIVGQKITSIFFFYK